MNNQKEGVLIHITQIALKQIDFFKSKSQVYRTSLVDELISSKEEVTRGG